MQESPCSPPPPFYGPHPGLYFAPPPPQAFYGPPQSARAQHAVAGFQARQARNQARRFQQGAPVYPGPYPYGPFPGYF